MADDMRKALVQLNQDGSLALELAGLHARKLESLARRMQSAVPKGLPADTAALRSAALRLDHTAHEAIAAVASVIVQSARLELLATIRPLFEPESTEPHDK